MGTPGGAQHQRRHPRQLLTPLRRSNHLHLQFQRLGIGQIGGARDNHCHGLDAHLVARLDRESFAELMAGNIEVVRGVLHVLCERLRAHGGYAGDRATLDRAGR